MPARKQFVPIRRMDVKGLGEVEPGIDVRHPVFGQGKIERLLTSPDGFQMVEIEFTEHGMKTVVPEYARLSLAKPGK